MNEQLKPFDKVLVRRYDSNAWRCDLFSHVAEELGMYVCAGGNYEECIPYEGNEALLGTTDSPKPKRWRAENGGLYWALDINYVAYEVIEQYNKYDDRLYSVGNYFRTKEQAEEMAIKIRALLVKAMLKGE